MEWLRGQLFSPVVPDGVNKRRAASALEYVDGFFGVFRGRERIVMCGLALADWFWTGVAAKRAQWLRGLAKHR